MKFRWLIASALAATAIAAVVAALCWRAAESGGNRLGLTGAQQQNSRSADTFSADGAGPAGAVANLGVSRSFSHPIPPVLPPPAGVTVNPAGGAPKAPGPTHSPRSVAWSSSAKSALSPSGSTPAGTVSPQSPSTVAASLPLDPPVVPVADILAGVDLSDPAQRERAVAAMREFGENRTRLLHAKAHALGIPIRFAKEDGGVSELFAFRGDAPIYRTTMNVNAAISSAAYLIRQTAPYNLSGSGLRVGIWDGGSVRSTHQEFGSRVTIRDGSANDDHATHVGGTTAAAGVDARAKGMAPSLDIDSYDWNQDYAEMTASGAGDGTATVKLPLSNHSYGYNGTLADQGRYESIARDADVVADRLPFYLPFWAAGNEQRDFPTYGGYQTISFSSLAKNVVTVGAVNDAVTAGQRDPAKGTMSSFSSWGPCDDGRVKPDLVANGVEVYSTVASGDRSYEQLGWSGTSMASPSAMGSAALLVELYRRELGGQFPRASLLKALLLHTADDLGNAGPDYKFGWGLLNVKAAADVILVHKAQPIRPRFYEGQLSNAAKVQSFSFSWDGVTPLKATLCWTDPAGSAQTAGDSRMPNLVHNLDLRITSPDGTVFQPYVMPFVGAWTAASMSAPATRGDNNTDNVEQVLVGNTGQLGTYTMTVTVDGSLTTASQNYSIVVTGSGDPVNPPPSVNFVTPQNGSNFTPGSPVEVLVQATDSDKDQRPDIVGSVVLLLDGIQIAQFTTAPYEYTFVPPLVGNYRLEARATDSEGALGSAAVSFTVASDPPGTVVTSFTPPTADGPVQALAADAIGRIYVGGNFTKLNGTAHAPRIARLRPDGSPDTTFFFPGGGADAQVRALAYSRRGSVLYVGGSFASYDGWTRRALARVAVGQPGRNDGALDNFFDAQIEGSLENGAPHVQTIVVQPDGKILVGGSFARVLGQDRANLARFLSDGTLDAAFAPNPNGPVNAIALQPDGKILVGGAFSSLNGVAGSQRLARLNIDGSTDSTFLTGTGLNGPVNAIAVTLDGDIFVGGQFTSFGPFAGYNRMVKLSPAGVLDRKFNAAPGFDNEVNDIFLRSTGSLLVSGYFSSVGNEALRSPAAAVGRLLQMNTGGAVDATFNPAGSGANGPIIDTIALPNGDILVAGAFSTFNGTARQSLAVITGFSADKPGLTSQPFRNISAGDDLEEFFSASAEGTFVLVDANGNVQPPESLLPRGVRFDAVTGRLHGVPLDGGSHNIFIKFVPSATMSLSSVTRFLLNVNSAKVTYGQWRKAWFTNPSDLDSDDVSGPSAVRNGVGANNMLVYALDGGDPIAMDASRMPTVAFERFNRKDYLTLRSSKYPGAAAAVSPELSTDLAAWTTQSDQLSVTETSSGLVARPVIPAAEAEKQFLRLKIVPE